MKSIHPVLQRALRIIVPTLTMVAILLSAARTMMTPLFLQIEYRTPDFPEDVYGFTQAERLKWAPMALAYLLNDEGIDFLGELEFEDGSPLFNERELGHMVDVKRLTEAGLRVWYGTLGILAFLSAWAWRTGWWRQYRGMLASGGRLLVVMIGVLVLAVLVSFNQVFTGFHRIFFEGDTWLFLYSDTLIRLFPLRFWRDVFLALGSLTLGGGLLSWYFFGRNAER